MVGLHGKMSVVSKVEFKASQWRWTLQKVSMLAPPFIFSRKDFSNKSPGKIAHIEICLSIVIYAISKFSTISCRQDDKEARLILNITTIVLYPPLKSENCFYCVAYLSIRLTSQFGGKKGVEHTYGLPALMVTTNERVSHSEGVRP